MMIHPDTARDILQRAVTRAGVPHEIKVTNRPVLTRHKMWFRDAPAEPAFSSATARLLRMVVEIQDSCTAYNLWSEVLAEALADWIRATCAQAKEGQKYSLVLGDFGMEARSKSLHFYAGFLLDNEGFAPPARETLAPITEPVRKAMTLRDQIEECRDNEAAFVRSFCAGPENDARVAKILYHLGKDPSRRVAVLTAAPLDIRHGLNLARTFVDKVNALRTTDEVVAAVFPELAHAHVVMDGGLGSGWKLQESNHRDRSLGVLHFGEYLTGWRFDEVMPFDFDPATASENVRNWYNEIVMPRVVALS